MLSTLSPLNKRHARTAAELIFATAPDQFSYVFGALTQEERLGLLQALWKSPATLPSSSCTYALCEGGDIVGMCIMYPAHQEWWRASASIAVVIRHLFFKPIKLMRIGMAYLRLRKIFSRIPEGHWYIANFAIHPQFQGKGKGTQLLSEVIAEVKKHKAEHITLDTASDNVRALRLYEHAGFKTVHVFASNYAGLAPRSRMTLALRYPQQFLG